MKQQNTVRSKSQYDNIVRSVSNCLYGSAACNECPHQDKNDCDVQLLTDALDALICAQQYMNTEWDGFPTDDELQKICEVVNHPVDRCSVYVFEAKIADNEVDDSFDRFPRSLLKSLGEKFIQSIKNITIFDTYITTDTDHIVNGGEHYIELYAKCFVYKIPENLALIEKLQKGQSMELRSKVSVNNKICNICGKYKGDCDHKKGKLYKVDHQWMLAYDILRNPCEVVDFWVQASSKAN